MLQEELGYQQILSISFSLQPGLNLSIFFIAFDQQWKQDIYFFLFFYETEKVAQYLCAAIKLLVII